MSSQLVWLATSRVWRPAGVPSTRTRAPTIQAAAAEEALRPGRAAEAAALVTMWSGATTREQQEQPGDAQDRARRSADGCRS